MNCPQLEAPLRSLLLRYREHPFSDWERLCDASKEHHDYSKEDETFWQADTSVLYVETDSDRRRYAHVSITIYPDGIHTVPPAPSCGFFCFDDGSGDIWTPWDESYAHMQGR